MRDSKHDNNQHNSNSDNDGDSEQELEQFTACLRRVREGSMDAIDELYKQYFARSVLHAQANLRDGEGRIIDGEVAANSALDSLIHRVRGGAYGDVTDQVAMWRLVAKIVDRKVTKYRRRMYGPTRSPRKPILAVDQIGDDSSQGDGPVPLAAGGPSPLAQAIADESLNRLLAHLSDADAKAVLLLRLEGYSDLEISEHLGHSRSWVQRRSDTIRRVAQSLMSEDAL
ncbi:ECF-type sigma factor [Planctomycetaceae bacterium SH139]